VNVAVANPPLATVHEGELTTSPPLPETVQSSSVPSGFVAVKPAAYTVTEVPGRPPTGGEPLEGLTDMIIAA
jgi:hypothetical protein